MVNDILFTRQPWKNFGKRKKGLQLDSLEGIKAEARYVTLNDMFTLWAKVKRGLKDNTFQNYLYLYRQFVEPDFGKSKVSALKKSDMKQFYNILADERGLQISTIDSVHTVLHQVLDMAVDDRYLRSNPSDNVLRELKKAHQLKPPTAKRLLFRSRIYCCPTFPKHRSTSTGIRFSRLCWERVCA